MVVRKSPSSQHLRRSPDWRKQYPDYAYCITELVRTVPSKRHENMACEEMLERLKET